MAQTWRVSWNKSFYNYQQLIQDFNNGTHSGIIFQSKGRARMVNLPKINDIVYISCNKLHIMTCTVISNFIDNGNEEQVDSYNLGGGNRPHANNIYLAMKIDIIHDEPDRFLGRQRTWCRI